MEGKLQEDVKGKGLNSPYATKDGLFSVCVCACVCVCVCMRAYVNLLQLCLILCDPMNCSPPDFSVHGILQARILEWVANPSSKGIFQTQGLNLHLMSPAFAGGFFITSTTWEAHHNICLVINRVSWLMILLFT